MRRWAGSWSPARDSEVWELYHLINDPGETTDISTRKPNLVAGLKREFTLWSERVSE